MRDNKPLTALGLMSGTSLDGVDAALIDTDGERVLSFGPARAVPYPDDFRARLGAVLGRESGADVDDVGRRLTLFHARAVADLLEENGLEASAVDIVGFSGHTVLHRPGAGKTVQIGDGALLASRLGISVVADFRIRDVAEGGQGAPLAPLFHAALAGDLEKPLAVLNVGGVANVTWIGEGGALLAFDTGPGNALIDDWMVKTTGRPFDENGSLAGSGEADRGLVAALLDHDYFRRPPPKSLDRNDFCADRLLEMPAEDGAATLTAFTAGAVAQARAFFPEEPRRWLVCGGGRLNRALMAALAGAVEGPVEAVESVGWDGDALEAQAFAFLAVRSLKGMPLSLPETTGVARPTTGGVLYRP